MTATPTQAKRLRSPTDHRQLGRVLVLAGIVLSAFSLRTAVTSLTPLLGRVGDDLGFGASVAGVLGMVPTAMFAVAGLGTPAVVRRIGLERSALVAMSLAAVGLAGRSIGGTWGLLALSAVALAGMGMGNVVLPPLVKRFFPDRVASMSTLYIAVLQIGTMIPPLLAVPVSDAHGWRIALSLWAVLAVAALVPWLLLIRRPHQDGYVVDETPATQVPGRVRHSPVAWGLTLMFAMTSLNTYAMFTWLPEILTDAGHSAALGGQMVALFSAIGLASALAAPQLAGRLDNPFPVVIGSVLSFTAGYAGLLWSADTLPALWVVLVGFGPTTFPLALTLINVRTRTAAGSAALSGFSQGLGYALACLGPLGFGLLHDATGGWDASFGMLAITLVLLVIGGYAACKPRLLEDTWHRSGQAEVPSSR
ncbi:CynX/NimT family MFS transporter [Luteipulveratus mongoliensis]|uniref:MFS transporter n=1 Tax=Luteipulveratus mongoliensis TaxID=571913 RepID=A0A0K1JMH2_9MICO|nr:MFS transporter [Luteipulveratus mongoliensis]AKU17778.1 MFS transporter [Luteipulveratus mongoliensis]